MVIEPDGLSFIAKLLSFGFLATKDRKTMKNRRFIPYGSLLVAGAGPEHATFG